MERDVVETEEIGVIAVSCLPRLKSAKQLGPSLLHRATVVPLLQLLPVDGDKDSFAAILDGGNPGDLTGDGGGTNIQIELAFQVGNNGLETREADLRAYFA